MKDNDYTTRTLENVVNFVLEVSLWDGRRVLQKDDLVLIKADQLPPEKAATLGSKYIYPRERLNGPASVKREAELALEEVGTRFLKGVWAVPKDRAAEIFTKLDKELREKFQKAVAEIDAEYDTVLPKYIAEQTEDWWKKVLEKAVYPRESAIARYKWAVRVFSIAEVDHELAKAAPTINDGLKASVGGLAGQLLEEVGLIARKAVTKTLKGKMSVSARSFNFLAGIREKLDGLSFVDFRIKPVIDRLDATMSALPKTGEVSGHHMNAAIGILEVLAEPDRVRTFAESILNNGQADVATDEIESEVSTIPANAELELEDPETHDEPAVPVSLPRVSGFF